MVKDLRVFQGRDARLSDFVGGCKRCKKCGLLLREGVVSLVDDDFCCFCLRVLDVEDL